MQKSTKTPRINNMKTRVNQVSFPHNTGIQFLSAPKVLHTANQMNRKYINNFRNTNEVPVLQYNRTSNMAEKCNNNAESYSQNIRQHPQHFVYEIPLHQRHINSSLPQRDQNIFFFQRTIQKNHQNSFDKSLSSSIKKSRAINCKDSLTQTKKDIKGQFQKKTQNVENLDASTIKNGAFESNQTLQGTSQQLQSNKFVNEETKLLNNHTTSSLDLLPSHVKNKRDCGILERSVVSEETNSTSSSADKNNIEDEDQVEQEFTEPKSIDGRSDDVDADDIDAKQLKNAREKTPMCLINDLARFNKISFQYRLTSEDGPAHCKRFTVTLKLGDEEYTADGFKIKQAQHLAAKEAIEKTKYKHPTSKANRRNDDVSLAKSNITPTVELNALAMKLGQQTYYIFDPKQINMHENHFCQQDVFKMNYKVNPFELNKTAQKSVTVDNFSGKFVFNATNNGKLMQLNTKPQFTFHNRVLPFQNSTQIGSAALTSSATYFPASSPCKITLIVGTKQFIGIGRTLQQAKHNAASNALQVLKEQLHNKELESSNERVNKNDIKSPISSVFEIGIRRNLPVDFKVMREEGPAHMRSFTTACIVGDMVAEGEGTGKKASKKKAAQKMLEELNKLPPAMTVSSPINRNKCKNLLKKRGGAPQTTSSNLVDSKKEIDKKCKKNKKTNIETDSTNPITKLLEWHQHNKEKEPVFKLISETGNENSRNRQFVMEVSSSQIVVQGVGKSKKVAKREAARNLLIAINESDRSKSASETDDNSKEVIYCESASNIENKHVTNSEKKSYIENNEAVRYSEDNSNASKNSSITINIPSSSSCKHNTNLIITAAPNEISNTTSPTNISSKAQSLHMKDQLLYLAKLLGFEVDFSDYPKGNHNEFLTIVMLSTNPPQICHGVGLNSKESREDAARNALKILSEMGLNT